MTGKNKNNEITHFEESFTLNYIGEGGIIDRLGGVTISSGLLLINMFKKEDILLYSKKIIISIYMDDGIYQNLGYGRLLIFLNTVKETLRFSI